MATFIRGGQESAPKSPTFLCCKTLPVMPKKLMKIFIDTSIVIQENYLSGKKFQRLAQLGHQNVIELYFTDVIEKEIFYNISKSCQNLEQAHKSYKRTLDTKHRILKNFYDISSLSYNLSFFESKFIKKFERFTDYAKIQTIKPFKNFDISKIMDDYFKSNPPFNSSRKKNEFPDAVSFHTAEKFLKSEKEKGIYLTCDPDFHKIESSHLEIVTDLSELLERIIKNKNPTIFNDNQLILSAIQSDIELFKTAIIPEIELDVMIHFNDIFDKYGVKNREENHKNTSINIGQIDVFDKTEYLIGFKCKGIYETDYHYLLERNTDFETYHQLIKLEKLILNDKGFIICKGDFEISFYYEFEFPYKVIKESIEVEEGKVIKSINNM